MSTVSYPMVFVVVGLGDAANGSSPLVVAPTKWEPDICYLTSRSGSITYWKEKNYLKTRYDSERPMNPSGRNTAPLGGMEGFHVQGTVVYPPSTLTFRIGDPLKGLEGEIDWQGSTYGRNTAPLGGMEGFHVQGTVVYPPSTLTFRIGDPLKGLEGETN